MRARRATICLQDSDPMRKKMTSDQMGWDQLMRL
jgi:hypothetical protein